MSRNKHWLLLTVIMLVAIGLRFWRLTSLPPGFYYAEAFEGVEAWRILTHPAYRPLFIAGNFGVPPLNIYANAFMFGLFQLFGGAVGPLPMRVTAACFGVLGVWALYGLAVELQQLNKTENGLSLGFPFFAAGTLAVMRWHFHFSRIGIEAILTPLLWASATWCFLRGWRTGQRLLFVVCGVLLAATIYAYKSAWVIPGLMIPVVGLLLLQKAKVKFSDWNMTAQTPPAELAKVRMQRWVGVAVAATVAFVLVVPLGWFFWHHPEVPLFHPGQLAVASNPADKHSSVWYSITATLKMYVPFGKTGDQSPRHNLPGAPALNLWQALGFFLGFWVAVRRIRQPSYAIPLIGLVGLLLPGAFTTGAPHFHRVLGVTAPTALLCGMGLDALWQWRNFPVAGDGRGQQESSWFPLAWPMGWVSLLLLVVGGAVATREYFVQWAALPNLYDKFDVGMWEVGKQVMANPGAPVYLTPHDADSASLTLALESTHHPPLVEFDGRSIFPLTAQTSPAPEYYLVLEHEDFRTHLLLPELFPTAQRVQAVYDDQRQVQAWLYRRPAGVIPQRPPQHPLALELGDGIALAGYDVQPEQPQAGKSLYLQLHWLVKNKPTANWTVFTHLLVQDALGQKRLVCGQDSQPGAGSLPTSQWLPGWRVLDEYELRLPRDLATGQYQVEIGLYQPDGQRLPRTAEGILLGLIHLVKRS
ncbi:MAG: hypothetical protein U0350_24625 [Caldilineaceae bacterium]